MVPLSPMNMVHPRPYLSVFIGVCALTYVGVLGKASAMHARVYVIYMRACLYDRHHFHASSWQWWDCHCVRVRVCVCVCVLLPMWWKERRCERGSVCVHVYEFECDVCVWVWVSVSVGECVCVWECPVFLAILSCCAQIRHTDALMAGPFMMENDALSTPAASEACHNSTSQRRARL